MLEESKPPETVKDESAAFQYGINGDHLTLYADAHPGPFETKAYVEGIGIVLFTNVGTIGNKLKMKVGKDARLPPADKLVFVTREIVAMLGLQKESIKMRTTENQSNVEPDITGERIRAVTEEQAKKAVGM